MSRQDRIDRREAARAESTGYGGTLSCRESVVSALDIIRQRIGEGVVMRASWDRTGIQEFPILGEGAKTGWPAVEIFGKSGRFELSAKGAQLPVDSVGFGYRVDGDDVVIDLDAVTLKGLALRLNPASTEAPGSSPAGMDPITIAWTVFSVLRMVWQVMHPQASVMLGGNVSCEAVLTGDGLAIRFSQCPSVKLKVIWTMSLAVTGVDLTPEKAVVLLRGDGMIASLIKSRDFVLN